MPKLYQTDHPDWPPRGYRWKRYDRLTEQQREEPDPARILKWIAILCLLGGLSTIPLVVRVIMDTPGDSSSTIESFNARERFDK